MLEEKNVCFFFSFKIESRSEFLEKLQRARSQVKPSTTSQPILSAPGPAKLTVGNWSLTCLKEGEIAIHNSDGQQATILKEDLPGFVFESNRGTKHSFTAETSLGKYVGMCYVQVGASVYEVIFLFVFHTCEKL